MLHGKYCTISCVIASPWLTIWAKYGIMAIFLYFPLTFRGIGIHVLHNFSLVEVYSTS